MNIKPTMREVRVVLNALGLKHKYRHFNDKRVNGGRIKLYGTSFSNVDMSKMRVLLQTMFPSLNVDVYDWDAGIKSTCIKWEL